MQVFTERGYEGDYTEVNPLHQHRSGKFPAQVAHQRLRRTPTSAASCQTWDSNSQTHMWVRDERTGRPGCHGEPQLSFCHHGDPQKRDVSRVEVASENSPLITRGVTPSGSQSWGQFCSPPPGAPVSDLTTQESSFSCVTVSISISVSEHVLDLGEKEAAC